MTGTTLGRILTFIAVVLPLAGCAGRWERGFHYEPMSGKNESKLTGDVNIRTVEAQRLKSYLQEHNSRLAASDLAYEDWPTEEKRAERVRFLRTLRIREEPENIKLLGHSSFVAESRQDPYSGELKKFAEKIGADLVIVTVDYLGQRQTVRSYPATTWSTITLHHRDNDKRYSDTGHVSSTTYVPVSVTVDQYLHLAYFFQTQPPRPPRPHE